MKFIKVKLVLMDRAFYSEIIVCFLELTID